MGCAGLVACVLKCLNTSKREGRTRAKKLDHSLQRTRQRCLTVGVLLCNAVVVGLGVYDCVLDWQVYVDRKTQIDETCQSISTATHFPISSGALAAMIVFCSIGTVLLIIDVVNLCSELVLLSFGSDKDFVFHPLMISSLVVYFEEIPLAILRWLLMGYLSGSAHVSDYLGTAAAVLSITHPLLKLYSILMNLCCKCFCEECCKDCYKECGTVKTVVPFPAQYMWWGLIAIGLVTVLVFNSLNWSGIYPDMQGCFRNNDTLHSNTTD